MQRIDLDRIAAIYLPLAAAVMAGLLRRRQKRMFVACLLGTLWTLPALLVVERINRMAHWWSFHPVGPALVGIPLELYCGWVILWGSVPILLIRKLNLPEVLVLFGALDLWLMSYLEPLLHLQGPQWLWGEAAALAIVLAPAYCLARWTLDGTHLKLRAALQVALAGMVFLFLLPELAFAVRPAAGMDSVWQPLMEMPLTMLAAVLQVIAMAALPGVSAVMEFALRGYGTPIPYDPPRRLVWSGIYRYCANPMQFSCAVVMFLWALALRNPWLAAAALVSTIYSAGIAHWDEERDLARRYGAAWWWHRAAAPVWQLRWRPYDAEPPARLYMARTCGQCSVLRAWIEAQQPLGLEILDAETLPQGSIRRMRYDPADGTVPQEGLLAFARALEHMNLFWAWSGMILRLPVLHQGLQFVLDLCGFGPRTIASQCATLPGIARQ